MEHGSFSGKTVEESGPEFFDGPVLLALRCRRSPLE